jgi:protein deglycase
MDRYIGGNMVKVACLMADGFEESEAIIVVDILRRAEFQVDLVSIHQLMVNSARNIRIQADKLFEDMDDYDMIYVPGGLLGSENLAKDQRVVSLLQSYTKSNKYISAICAAPTVLGQANIVDQKNLTSHPSVKLDLRLLNANYLEQDVVIDDRLITSRGVGTAIDFALTLVDVLGGDGQRIADQIVYSKNYK